MSRHTPNKPPEEDLEKEIEALTRTSNGRWIAIILAIATLVPGSIALLVAHC